MLSGDELRRRLIAARTLRGLKQDQLGEMFEKYGLGLHDPGRIERGTLTMLGAHRDAFIKLLRMPSSWFTEPDVDVLIGLKPRRPLSPTELQDLLGSLLVGHAPDEGQAGSETSRSPDDKDLPGGAAANG